MRLVHWSPREVLVQVGGDETRGITGEDEGGSEGGGSKGGGSKGGG
eukprot:CAMPEP_0119307992 /NCGR_PEP_ID=MMETSP1333-20130426/8334_1 /TAXON_ID=418940 /ORGANISM="Scyphosphaera apsteinii, Strain RCC1455" /LENGTH=45 /DNA_ID= /DNA_START= /DNA_END= /DNA_ORIENTATION=